MTWLQRINLLALALCFCVVVFGAYVRLSDAGLGCPDWPGCYGHLTVPDAQHELDAAAETFPQRPVEAPKAWKEMIHRYLASTLGLLIVAMAVMSLFSRLPGRPRILPWALVGLVMFQGILGMWTVTWQLKPLVVTGHLLGGMTTLALLLWHWLRLRAASQGARVLPPGPAGIRAFAAVGLLVLVCQIFLGGWTSTNYAALACPDFPTCHGVYLPEINVPKAFTLWHGLGINYEYGILDSRERVTIHLFHRIGAIITAFTLLLLGLLLLRKGGATLWRPMGIALIAALALQLTIGVSIVILQLPLLLAAGHNAGAAILLMVLVALNFQASRKNPG